MPIASLVLLAAFLPLQANQKSDAPAPARTNFSGRWRMDKEKSNFGRFKMPNIVVRVIDQKDPIMNVHMVQTTGDRTTTVDTVYMTDGSTTKNVINGRDASSRAFWDGKDLVIRTDMKTLKNEDEDIEDRYTLSGDGQELTMTSHVITEKGDVTMTMVCRKEAIKQ